MSAISAYDKPEFERWVIQHYPKIFSAFEVSSAAEYMDLDEWAERNHGDIINEFREGQRKKKSDVRP